VRDATKEFFKPLTIEESQEKQISGETTLNERLTDENFADNAFFILGPTNAWPRVHSRNEDPYNAGQIARLSLYISSRRPEFRAFALYEDNILLRLWNEIIPPLGNTSKDVEIRREKGLHTYELRVWDKMGRMIKSYPVKVNYSGKFTDQPPTITEFDGASVVGEDFFAYRFLLSDYGDNPGIESITVYQNGRVAKVLPYSGGDEFLITGLKPGKHQFKFTVKDKGGNTVESRPLEILTGPNPQPKIERIE